METAEEQRRSPRMRELLNAYMAAEITSEKWRELMAGYGIPETELRNAWVPVMGLIEKAAKGDVAAYTKIEELMERSGEEALFSDADRALHILRRTYLENINSSFGEASVYALKHRYTHYDIAGGRGSTKSSWVSLTVIRLLMEHPDTHALVLRKVANTLRDSVFAQYTWSLNQLEVAEFWETRKSPLELVYLPTGQRILFRGTDDSMKLKSVKVPFGYIGITHFEEKDQFDGREELDNVLQSTMRGGMVFWNFESYNPPRSLDNWANRDGSRERPDRYRHRSTYLDLDDPDWLGPQFYREAEQLKRDNPKRYENEYLGVPTGSGGTVFENLELRRIPDEELAAFDRYYQGVDWGWFPDPYAFIRLHYDAARETIYLTEEHVCEKASNEDTARWILERGYGGVTTVCDSAEPKSVADYRSLGVRAQKAVKGPNSVDYGMKWLQKRKIVIDPARTPRAYEEFTRYEYEKNRSGEWVSGYPDRDNHLIDAVRYALERVMNKYRSNA